MVSRGKNLIYLCYIYINAMAHIETAFICHISQMKAAAEFYGS